MDNEDIDVPKRRRKQDPLIRRGPPKQNTMEVGEYKGNTDEEEGEPFGAATVTPYVSKNGVQVPLLNIKNENENQGNVGQKVAAIEGKLSNQSSSADLSTGSSTSRPPLSARGSVVGNKTIIEGLDESYVKSINRSVRIEQAPPAEQKDLYVFRITKNNGLFKWDWVINNNPNEPTRKRKNPDSVYTGDIMDNDNKFFTSFDILKDLTKREELVTYYARFFRGAFIRHNTSQTEEAGTLSPNLDVNVFIGQQKFRFHPDFLPPKYSPTLRIQPLVVGIRDRNTNEIVRKIAYY